MSILEWVANLDPAWAECVVDQAGMGIDPGSRSIQKSDGLVEGGERRGRLRASLGINHQW
jgi:hypothetical protein